MDAVSVSSPSASSRIKLFLALSRTPHLLLDLASPALAALLWLGALPPLKVAALGLVTVFAGYTAVYALNDVVDYQGDRAKIQEGGLEDSDGYLDAAFVRHPMARGLLGFKEGLLWTAGWALVALVGAYTLNPVCALIFLCGCFLETIYCLLLRVSHLRTLVSGVVKTLGGVAAVFAVDPQPSPPLLTILVLWLFFWEIGGQNIPADWYDIEEDQRWQAKTVPVCYGARGAGVLILGCLALSVALSAALFRLSPARLPLPLLALGLAAGFYLLLIPGFRLWRTKDRSQASALFNQASYYPLAILAVVLVGLMA